MTAEPSARPKPSSCAHEVLTFSPSSHAVAEGYSRPTQAQRLAACTPSGRPPKRPTASTPSLVSDNPATFPAPLVLPNDDLTLNPSYPPQSLLSWTREKYRNKVTQERRTIYIAAPPSVHPDVPFIRKWSEPQIQRQKRGDDAVELQINDIVGYLSAFYHGLPVKELPAGLQFSAWDGDSNGHNLPQRPSKPRSIPYIAIKCAGFSTRIRARASPNGIYTHQLNLSDLLDATISLLPDDAYALLLLTTHDLYEDEDDDFVCGRAYGGSRVAVVSTARYHPALDEIQGVERLHAWPASHCSSYVQEQTIPRPSKKRKGVAVPKGKIYDSSPALRSSAMGAALLAYQNADSTQSPAALSSLLTYRVARTVSHELGHCFGLDHCVYFACIMQGSASIQEDARQPPYLCPVDLAKVLRAIGTTESERDSKLKEYCDLKGLAWNAFGAWLGARQGEREEKVVIVIDD